MLKMLNKVLKRRFIFDFYENPGELLDEVKRIKVNRYLRLEDSEENDIFTGIIASADFSDGDEPDDITGVEDYDEIEDYFCFDEIEDNLEIEDIEEVEKYNNQYLDIEYLEIILNQYANA